MIKPNWEIFSAKFENKEDIFEWFAYLLFCREFNLAKGWFGFKNQSAIEKNPIEIDDEVIGFQAKFYSTSLSDHKTDFLEMLQKAKRDYPNLNKILVYTNQLWGQAYDNAQKKMVAPKALYEIKAEATRLGIELIWREASFFDSEFVCLENDDLSRHFFTEQSMLGWQRFGDWSSTRTDIEAEYFIDDNIKVISPNHKDKNELNVVEGINEIRQQLSKTGKSIRLVGLSGVGKTRFAQALFDERIGENNLEYKVVWYCDLGDSPNPIPEHFIDELIQKNSFSILIVDNCGQDTHANLTKKIKSKNLSLLTIEYDVKDDSPERTSVYKLKPISSDIVKKVIERHYPHINDLNSRKIAEFSGGNYRLALAIASNIEQTENISLLTDNHLFERLFWQNGIKNDQLEKIAQQFSLVYSFNVEDSGEENSEIDFLANLAKVDTDIAYEEIEKLRQKDIVQQRSKWRAILPHAVANHLAKQAISKKSITLLNRDFEQMPQRLQRSFIKRLSYLHDQIKVKQLIQLWLSEEGWLGRKLLNETFDTADITYLNLLAPIIPEQALVLLENVHAINPKFLSRENPSFVELSRLIRRLAYREENFKQAFELLVYFAKDEKQDENNNSIKDLITSLFKLYTSETLANLELKKEVLTNFFKQEDRHTLLLKILQIALNFHEYGVLYNYDDSGEAICYGYQPKTYKEIWGWVDFLLDLLDKFDIAGNKEVRKIFANSLKQIIWKSGRTEEAKKYLIKFNERKYFCEVYTKITEILSYSRNELEKNAPKLLEEIIILQEYLTPKENDISQLLETYVFIDDNTLYRLHKNDDDQYALPVNGFESYDDLIEFLATEIKNLDVLNKNVEKLMNAQHGWASNKYLEKLGFSSASVFESVDSCIEKLNEIVIPETLRFSEFLLGLVKSFKDQSSEKYKILVDYLIENDKFKNVVTRLIFETCKTDDDFLYFSDLIKSRNIGLVNFPRVSFYKDKGKITNTQFELLLDSLVEVCSIEEILYFLLDECLYQEKLDEKYINILIENFYVVLAKEGNLDAHSIAGALKFLLSLNNYTKIKVLTDVKKFLNSGSYISIYRNSNNFRILKTCVEQCTKEFIEILLEDKSFIEKFWNRDLLKILVYANEQEVISWIGLDQERLNFWIENSRLFIIKESGELIWLDLLGKFLTISTSPIETLTQIIETNIFRLMSAQGSWSEEMRRRLPSLTALKAQLTVSHPELLPLVNQKEAEWLSRIDIQSKKDEQESKERSERFDW